MTYIFQSGSIGSGDSEIDLDGEDLDDDSDEEIEHGELGMANPRARKQKAELDDSDNDF